MNSYSPDLTSEQPMIFTRYLMHNMSNKNTLKVSDGTIVRWDKCNGRGDQLQMLKFRTCNPTQKSQRCFLHMDPMAVKWECPQTVWHCGRGELKASPNIVVLVFNRRLYIKPKPRSGLSTCPGMLQGKRRWLLASLLK